MRRSILLGLLVGAVLIAAWLWFIDPAQVAAYLKMLHPLWLAVAAVLYLLAYFLRSLRWRVLLRPTLRLPVRQVYLVWMSGHFFNYLIPIRAGELVKCWLLKRLHGARISQTLPSVFVDKLFDSLAILIVLALLPFLSVHMSQPMLWLIILLVLVLAAAIGVLVAAAVSQRAVVSLLRKVLFFVPRRFEQRIEEAIGIFVQGVGMFRRHMNLLPPVMLLTLAAVLADSLFFYSLFLAFRQSVPYLLILFGYTLIYLSYILPTPPAQIGSNEVIMVVIFSIGLGLNRDMVSAVMSFSHLLTGALIVTVGLLASSTLGVRLLDLFSWRSQPEE